VWICSPPARPSVHTHHISPNEADKGQLNTAPVRNALGQPKGQTDVLITKGHWIRKSANWCNTWISILLKKKSQREYTGYLNPHVLVDSF